MDRRDPPGGAGVLLLPVQPDLFCPVARVETYRFMSTVADDGEVQYWVPEECVFPNLNETSDAVVYWVYERRGPLPWSILPRLLK